jgi:hypothetical protein
MEQLSQELDLAFSHTTALLGSLSPQALNTVPFTGSWTAAQVARHLYKSQKGAGAMLLQPTEEPQRDPAARVPEYRRILLDFDHKLESPDFLIPEDETYDKGDLIAALERVKDEIVPAIEKANLNETAPQPEQSPLYGSTKLEIAHFLLYHTQRHNRQIEKIKEALA